LTIAVVGARLAEAQDAAAGATIFAERCAVCHQDNGQGVAGTFPPLNETLGHFLVTTSGRRYLGEVLAFGLAGAISVGGQPYVGQMKLIPPLSDQEIADVLTYVLTTFNAGSLPADAGAVSVDEIAALRTTPKAPTEVAKGRQAVVAELKQIGLER
jgi:mono/diheme cytochrome c family protein